MNIHGIMVELYWTKNREQQRIARTVRQETNQRHIDEITGIVLEEKHVSSSK